MIRIAPSSGHVGTAARLLPLMTIAIALAAAPASATTVTYTELIEDLNFQRPSPIPDTRDLRRTRTYGDGSVHVEDGDAAIASDNALSTNWGLLSNSDATWFHRFIFIPPVDTFVTGTFTLKVADVEGIGGADPGIPNDRVQFEDVAFNFFLKTGTESTLTLTTSSVTLFMTHLLDGSMKVELFPLGPAPNGDHMEIKSSRVDLTYNTVPEAGPSFALFGAVVAGMALVARRRSGAAARS